MPIHQVWGRANCGPFCDLTFSKSYHASRKKQQQCLIIRYNSKINEGIIWHMEFDSLSFKLCTIYEEYNRKKIPVCYHMVLGSQGVRQSGSKFTFSCDLKCKPS